MSNLFVQSRFHWVRYDRYEIKTGKDGKRHIMPKNHFLKEETMETEK